MSKPDLNTSSRESLKERKLDAGEAGADLANLGIMATKVPLTAKQNSSKKNIAAERRNTEGSKESSVQGADSIMNTPQNIRLAPMELYKGDYDLSNKNVAPVTTGGLIKNGNKKGIMSAVDDGGQQFSTILMNSQSQQQHQNTTKKIIARDGKSQMSSMPRHKVVPVSSFAQGETENGPISQLGSKKPITTDDSQNDGNTLQSKRDTALIAQETVGIILGARDESYGNFNNQATPQNNTRMLSEQTTLTENKPTSVDIKIVNKSTDRSGYQNNGANHYQVMNNGEMITLQTQTQAQFFKLSADEKLKSGALRRRQNKLYLNKLPRAQNSKEKVLYPSGSNTQPQQHRAANSLQTGGPQSTTQMEVAAWMGRKANDQNRIHKVGNHIEEMSVLQKTTQLAPAHGKERTSKGIYIHGVSGARQAMFIDAGLKRTYPLTMQQTGPAGQRSVSRQSQQHQDPNQEFESYARTLNEQIVRHDSSGRHHPEDGSDIRASAGGRKSNLRSSSRQIVPLNANQGIFNENQVYTNQHVDSLKRQSTDIVRNVEWETKDQLQHLSSEVFNYNKSGKLQVNRDDEANSDLDKVLLERVGRHIVTTSKKQLGQSNNYRRKSINSKRNSSFGRASHFQKDSQHTIVRRSSTDINTNFDSMIARYQTQGAPNQVQPQTGSPPTDERRGKTSLDFKQAKQFKNILEQPIGKMWFPSLGGAGATTSTIYSSTMPQSGKQATLKGTLNQQRQAAQAAGLQQERSRTQQKARQVDKNAYFSKERQNNFASVGANGLNMTVPVKKDYDRAKKIYENVGHVIQNQETLENRLKQSTSLKVKKNTNGISIQPLSEKDMRPFGISVPDGKNASNIMLHDNTLTNEQQDILAKIRVNANQQAQPRLQSNSQSPIHQKNPKIFVQTKHSFKNVHQSLQQDTSLNQPKRTTSQYTIKDQVSNYINGRPCHSRSQQQSSTRSISSAGPTGYGNERDSSKFVQGREYQISQPELDHGVMQGLGSGIVVDEEDEMTEKEKRMNMKVIRSKLKEQVIAEQRYLNEMAHIKTNNRTFQHQFHRINARSKVNMYVSPGLTTQQNFTAARAAQPTVEGSLLKSRLVTNRWLNQVSKKKQELEEKMFRAGELRGALPYSEYSITQKEAGDKNNYGSQQLTSGRKKKRSTLNSETRSAYKNGAQNKSEYILNSKHKTGSDRSPGMSQNNTPGKDRSMDIRINGQESMFEDRPSQNNQTVTSDDRSAYQARNQDALNSRPMSDINASDLDDDDQQQEVGLNYQEALMTQAFSQLGNLKQRIDRQQNQDLTTRNLQFARVNEAMKQTQLMRDVEEEREILRLQEEMLQEEAKTNPDVLLSPRAMELKCIKPVPNVSQIYKDFGKVKQEECEYYTSHMEDEIEYAMSRQDGLQVPMWSQDFAYRLVKLNQVDSSMWNTKFIQKVEDMIKEIDELDGALKRQAKDKHQSYASTTSQQPRHVGSAANTATALKSSSIGQRGTGKSRKQVTVRVGNGPAK